MLRGLDGVVDPFEVEPGRFYVTWDGDGGTVPFLCVRSDEQFEGDPVDKALIFTEEAPGLSIGSVPDFGTIVRLPEVHIRIDPMQAVSNERMTGLHSGMILVTADGVIVTVPLNFRGWRAVNLSTGRYVVDGIPPRWVSFSTLTLLVDEDDEEKVIGGYRAAGAGAS